MPYSVVDKPSKYFTAKTYTGTGSTQSITGVGFQPDFVWIKDRSDAYDHRLCDSVRGATKLLYSSLTNAEATEATSLTSFNSDGFSLGSANGVNSNADNHVAWNWKANGAGASNTSGSITSTVSANTTSGFSIVSYTGTGANATVGHGLGVAPSMIIVKNRSAVEDWTIYHSTLGNTKLMDFTTGASQTSSTIWNNTSPTSTLFTVGTNSKVNGNTNSMIAYCFAEVKGYSKFGSYTGNGSADGTFIYTGFLPSFVMIKQTSSAGEGWEMGDNKRSTYNVITTFLRGNSSASESTNTDRQYDFVSNGIKMRGSHGSTNGSGSTYIYMCFAEQPFVSSKGIVANAR
jgi:hypothetical protein